MHAFRQRVVDEKTDLDAKLIRLKTFIETNPAFEGLPGDEQTRLNRQLDVMGEYSRILAQRIAAF